MSEEVQDLRNRVELLEQKLHLALAPFNSLFSVASEEGVAERASFLSQSFQQLDRIDSLSEQIGFLEERLETCEYLYPQRHQPHSSPSAANSRHCHLDNRPRSLPYRL
ncbi:EGFL7 protein, partial [Amia calva]|nr:EGFL7 protein [Amia calva]